MQIINSSYQKVQLKGKMENSNAIFKRFFDISPDLLCIARFDGYFKKINPSVSQLLGYSEEELLAEPISTFIYKEDLDATKIVRDAILNNNPLQNFENRYLCKDGTIVWLAWTSMPVMEEKLIYAIAKNVTHKKILEQERNALLVDFTRINDELKQSSYTSSHDLRSPVNNLLSIFSLLDSSNITDLETLEFIKMLEITSENLKETLNQYLDTFVERDNLNAKIELLNLNVSLDTVKLSISSLIQNSNASINTDFSEIENVNFNKGFLESIFLNLLTNSIKYARSYVNPIITIKSLINEGNVQLVFNDNGLGFDMKVVKDKIFGLHQKFHNHPDSKGIGLYLIHNHITSLGGTITVKSEVNAGTQFIITIKK